jgi:hypothetical protein
MEAKRFLKKCPYSHKICLLLFHPSICGCRLSGTRQERRWTKTTTKTSKEVSVRSLFAEGSQILAHVIFEHHYDWNLFQLFFLQQSITAYGILLQLGFMPELQSRIDELIPVAQKLMANM